MCIQCNSDQVSIIRDSFYLFITTWKEWHIFRESCSFASRQKTTNKAGLSIFKDDMGLVFPVFGGGGYLKEN